MQSGSPTQSASSTVPSAVPANPEAQYAMTGFPMTGASGYSSMPGMTPAMMYPGMFYPQYDPAMMQMIYQSMLHSMEAQQSKSPGSAEAIRRRAPRGHAGPPDHSQFRTLLAMDQLSKAFTIRWKTTFGISYHEAEELASSLFPSGQTNSLFGPLAKLAVYLFYFHNRCTQIKTARFFAISQNCVSVYCRDVRRRIIEQRPDLVERLVNRSPDDRSPSAFASPSPEKLLVGFDSF